MYVYQAANPISISPIASVTTVLCQVSTHTYIHGLGQSYSSTATYYIHTYIHMVGLGINQYGFDEYVGMSEGSHSMRYTTHQQQNTYHTGARYLFRNDVPLPRYTSYKQLLCMFVCVCVLTCILTKTAIHVFMFV